MAANCSYIVTFSFYDGSMDEASVKKKLSMAAAGTELASKSQDLISQGTNCSDLDAQLLAMKM